MVTTRTWREKLATFIDSTPVVLVMTIITIYALFFDDIRMIAFTLADDDIFFGITLFAMIAFTLELILSCIAKP